MALVKCLFMMVLHLAVDVECLPNISYEVHFDSSGVTRNAVGSTSLSAFRRYT